MQELLSKINVINFLIYFFLTIFLLGYFTFAHKKEGGIKIPVGLFVVFFLIKTISTVVVTLNVQPVMNGLNLAAMIFLTLAIIRLAVFIFVDYFLQHKKVIEIPVISRDIVLAILYLAAIMLILRYGAGVNLTSLITTSAVLTAVIGLALQDTLSNLFSGIVLQAEKPYHIGDWVSFDVYTGKVIGMSWKSTKILTRNKELVSVPNNVIARSHILNYSKPDPVHIATFEIGTSYKDPPNSVRETILATLLEHPEIFRTPEPEVRVLKFADFSINYLVRFHTADFEGEDKIKSHVLNQLWYRFNRKGITIPYPTRTILQGVPEPEKIERKKDHLFNLALSSLKFVDIFKPLSQESLIALARNVRFEDVSSGEIIIKEGDSGSSMYIIISGECDVVIGGDASEHLVATLGEGQFFGEMSLMTGEPRSATVKAKTDVVCVEITKEDMEKIVCDHPEVAESISEILGGRKQELESQKSDLRQTDRSDKKESSQLLAKIKAFFKI